MDIPDPALADRVADASTHATHTIEHTTDVLLAAVTRSLTWTGPGAHAFRTTTADLAHQLDQAHDAFTTQTTDWTHFADQLRTAHTKLAWITAAEHAADAALAASIIELGLDPAADLAAAASRASIQTALAELRHLLEQALTELTARLLQRQTLLTALRGLARYTLPRITTATALNITLDHWLTGTTHPGNTLRQLLHPTTLTAALLPGPKSFGNLDTAIWGKGVPQAIKMRGYPLGFSSKESFLSQMKGIQAAADEWAGAPVTVAVTGSSITGFKYGGTEPFDLRRSDIDLAVVSPELIGELRRVDITLRGPHGQRRSGPLNPNMLRDLDQDPLARLVARLPGGKTKSIMVYESAGAISARGQGFMRLGRIR